MICKVLSKENLVLTKERKGKIAPFPYSLPISWLWQPSLCSSWNSISQFRSFCRFWFGRSISCLRWGCWSSWPGLCFWWPTHTWDLWTCLTWSTGSRIRFRRSFSSTWLWSFLWKDCWQRKAPFGSGWLWSWSSWLSCYSLVFQALWSWSSLCQCTWLWS